MEQTSQKTDEQKLFQEGRNVVQLKTTTYHMISKLICSSVILPYGWVTIIIMCAVVFRAMLLWLWLSHSLWYSTFFVSKTIVIHKKMFLGAANDIHNYWWKVSQKLMQIGNSTNVDNTRCSSEVDKKPGIFPVINTLWLHYNIWK